MADAIIIDAMVGLMADAMVDEMVGSAPSL